MMRRARTIAFLAVQLLPLSALGYCLESRLKGDGHIPVYLQAENDTFVGIETNVVRHQLELALDNWYEKGAAEMRPYFAGVRGNNYRPKDGEVLVRETTDCDRCTRVACEKKEYSISTLFELGERTSSTVWLEHSCGVCYKVANGDGRCTGPSIELRSLLMHELGHSFGLEDEYELKCDDIPWSSAMAGSCNAGRTITQRDIGALQALYGRRAGAYDYLESRTGGLSWRAGEPANTVNIGPGIFRMGSMGVAVDREFFAAIHGNSSPRLTAAVTMKPAVAYSPQVPVPGIAGRSWNTGAAASKSVRSRAIAFTHLDSETDCRYGIVVLITDDDGASWTRRFVVDSNGVLLQGWSEGVSMAYDPERDVYVVAFADLENRVRVETIMASAPYTPGIPAFIRSERTIDTPAVACGPSPVTGPANCMVMWLGPDDYGRPRWVVGAVDEARVLKEGDVQTHFYRGWQTPSIAVQHSRMPWVMAMKQGTRLYTWRLGPGATGPWVDRRLALWTRDQGLLSGSLTVVTEPGVVAPPIAVTIGGNSPLALNSELHIWYARTAY